MVWHPQDTAERAQVPFNPRPPTTNREFWRRWAAFLSLPVIFFGGVIALGIWMRHT